MKNHHKYSLGAVYLLLASAAQAQFHEAQRCEQLTSADAALTQMINMREKAFKSLKEANAGGLKVQTLGVPGLCKLKAVDWYQSFRFTDQHVRSVTESSPSKTVDPSVSNQACAQFAFIVTELVATQCATPIKTGTPVEAEGRKGHKPSDPQTDTSIRRAEKLNGECRGGSGDSPKTLVVCAKRDAAYAALEKRGVCWGPNDASGAEKRWVSCQ